MRRVAFILLLSLASGCHPTIRRDPIEPASIGGWLWTATFRLDSSKSFRGRPSEPHVLASVVFTDSTARRKPRHEWWAFYRVDFGPFFGSRFQGSDSNAVTAWWVQGRRQEFALWLRPTHQIGAILLVGRLEGDSLVGTWHESWCCGGRAGGHFVMHRRGRFPYP